MLVGVRHSDRPKSINYATRNISWGGLPSTQTGDGDAERERKKRVTRAGFIPLWLFIFHRPFSFSTLIDQAGS